MSFRERKRKARQFEKRAGEYVRERFREYRIEEQKTFASGRRPDFWAVSKRDSRDRVPVEVKTHSETSVAHESDLKQLRMYQHHGMAKKGVLIYPESVRVPRQLRRQARESGQEIVKISEGGCLIATAAFGTHLVGEIDALREFRDRRLLQSAIGRHYVRIYCNASPPIAKWVAKIEPLRRVVRLLVRSALVLINPQTTNRTRQFDMPAQLS